MYVISKYLLISVLQIKIYCKLINFIEYTDYIELILFTISYALLI